jgi:hypothetical protein
MARTPQSCHNTSLSNYNKATKTIGGIKEEEQNNKGNTKFPSKI